MIDEFEPSSLGDIITNIAATLNTPIPNGQTFNEIMVKMKTADPEVYGLLQKLEAALRAEATKATTSITDVTYETVDLTSSAIEKPHFLWIAYANLRAESPEHPVLFQQLPPAPTPTPASSTQQVAAPTQQASTLQAPPTQQVAAPTQLLGAPSRLAQ